MMKLVLVRHGESEWNKLNLFTGWTDVDLSEKGHEEANVKHFFRNGEVVVKKDLPRDEIEAKLKMAKTELESAGFIYSRDLRKHIGLKLVKTLLYIAASEAHQAQHAVCSCCIFDSKPFETTR